jgi:TonB family protein
MDGRLALALAVLGSQAVWADLTIRYQFEFTAGPAIPAAAADTVKAQLAGILPGEMAMRIKGGKCINSFGPLNSIIDTGKGEITLFNPATKQFATVPAAGYADRVLAQQQVPAAMQQALQTALQSMKIDVETKKTGATSTIQGIQAEDNLIVFSISMPNPAGLSIGLRMEMHEWLAAPEESTRLPALKEIAGCSAGLGASADPSAIVEKILGPFAGANGLSDAMKQLTALKGKVALKTQLEIFAPGMVALLQAQGGQGLPANVDANAALMKLDFNMAELFSDPLSDALFQVPAGYQAAPLEDLLKAIPKPALAQAEPPKPKAPVAAAPINDFTGTAYRPDGGITNPAAVFRPEPKYTEEARQAKIQGSVLLSLVVDENGVARNIKVVRSLDPGLDQSAVDTVRGWKFMPGEKDGRPVAVMAQVEITFRLLDKPPDKQ